MDQCGLTPRPPCRLTYEPYGMEVEDGAPPMHMLHNPYAGNGRPAMQRQLPAVAVGSTSAPAFTPDKAQVCPALRALNSAVMLPTITHQAKQHPASNGCWLSPGLITCLEDLQQEPVAAPEPSQD